MRTHRSCIAHRKEELERNRRDAARERRERRIYLVDLITSIGIWVAAIVAVVAIYESDSASDAQYNALRDQQDLMRGQLNAMIAQQRPWISVHGQLDQPLVMAQLMPLGSEGSVTIPISLHLRNSGASPATNVVFRSELIISQPLHLFETEYLNNRQQVLCEAAESEARDSQKLGLAMFPGEERVTTDTVGVTTPKSRLSDELDSYLVQGCIDYTYNGNLHGKTGYRIAVGHVRVLGGEEIVEGFAFRTDAQKNPSPGVVVSYMKPQGLDVVESFFGGNWGR